MKLVAAFPVLALSIACSVWASDGCESELKRACLGPACFDSVSQPRVGDRHHLFGYGDYVQAENQEDYRKALLDGLTQDLLTPESITLMIRRCRPSGSAWGAFLRAMRDKESQTRRHFLKNMRIDGYRLEGNFFGWKCLTPAGIQQAIFMSPPASFERYRVDERKVFRADFARTIQTDFEWLWLDAMAKSLETLASTPEETRAGFEVILGGLKAARGSVLYERLNHLWNRTAKTNPLEFLQLIDRDRLTSTSFDDQAAAAMRDALALAHSPTAPDFEYQLLSPLRSCALNDLARSMRMVRALEQTLNNSSPQFRRVFNTAHWIHTFDLRGLYRSTLTVLQRCPQRYALLKALAAAYEETERGADREFYMDLIDAGRDAYRNERFR